jgi:phenylalanine-4-hydroxylase
VEGPLLLSRGGKAEGRPWAGEALVAFGRGELPARGAFNLALGSGLFLTGYKVGEHEVINLRAHLDGRPLDVPSWALLFLSATLPSVAGGPADPGAWDAWFGGSNAFAEGEAEAQARARKAEALPAPLAEAYEALRRMRGAAGPDLEALRRIAEAARRADDWLLLEEAEELLQPTAGALP